MSVHALTYPSTESKEYSKARYHYLLQIIFGETIAIDYCRKMSAFAPNAYARDFLLKQQREEDIHLELLTAYVGSHPRNDSQVSPYLRTMDKEMSNAIERKDYEACVFIQNFIVEGLNISFLRELEHHTDGALSELSGKILNEEIGHMEFGVSEVTRMLKEDKTGVLRKRFLTLQRTILYNSVGLSFDLAREAKDLGIPLPEFVNNTVKEHFERTRVAGLRLPLIDRIFFKGVIVLFTVV